MKRTWGFVSIDIEADGPVPGLNSMLALGAAAFEPTGKQISAFSVNLEPLPEAKQDPETMHEFWEKQPEAWAEVQRNPLHPRIAMPTFRDWIFGLRPGYFICVAKPAAFDFAYISYYLHRFAGINPFGFYCLDISSFWQGLGRVKVKFDKTGLRPHFALDDAIEQGRLLAALLKYREEHNLVRQNTVDDPVR